MKQLINVFIVVIVVFIFGCSSSSNLTTPETENRNPISSSSKISYHPIINHSVDGVTSYQGVFGAWKIHIDPLNLSAEIIPPRNAQAIGNIFDADLSQFLEVSPCADCISIGKVYLDAYEDLNVEFRMKHPFSNIATRPDLHGFDVRGIFIGESLESYQSFPDIKVMRPDGTEEEAQIASDLLRNADGYTSHFDELASDERYFIGGQDVPGNLNPFLRFYEDYSTPPFDPTNPVGHNVMKVGAAYYSRTAVFNLKFPYDEGFNFYFVADVAYGQSAVLANRTNPQYYLPAFQRTEPWRVEYWIENNFLDPGDSSSSADIMVQVFDWQQNATVDANYPKPSNLSGIPESSNVLRLELSIPGIQSDMVIVDTPESGTGTPSDPLLYRLQVVNSNSTGYNQTGLLAIRDELYGQAAPHGRIPIPVSPAGFPYETQDILDYTLYQLITVNIPFGSYPNADANSFGENELFVPWDDQFAYKWGSSDKTTIHPTFFMDDGHKKFQYRWDYNYDGISFNVDGSGNPSPEIEFPTGGIRHVGLKVRTNSVPPREYIFTIPIYAEDEVFHQKIPFITLNQDSTSSRHNHAVAATRDNFYSVYAREQGGERDIWLAILDRDGGLNNVQITNDPAWSEYDPVIAVVESGPNRGVYIAYSAWAGSKSCIYSTYGNLDGTGFDPSHTIRCTTAGSPLELHPVLLYFKGDLQLYYTNYLVLAAYINGCHSPDMGQTWIEDDWVVDNGSTGQWYPTAITYDYPEKICLVWEDNINSATRGTDLYMATSIDGQNFTDIKNISSYSDSTYETQPAAACASSQLAIAYLTYSGGPTKKSVKLKVINLSNNSVTECPVKFRTDFPWDNGQPSIDTITGGKYALAYSAYDHGTNELRSVILELNAADVTGYFYEGIYLDESVGTVDPAGGQTLPSVVCYNPFPYAVENFVVWQNYSSGFNFSSIDPDMYLGQIDATYFITYKEYIWY